MKHIIKHLSELLGVEVQFANDCMGEEAAVKAAALQPGEVLLLENLRFYAEEEGKPRGLAEDATDEEKAAAKKAAPKKEELKPEVFIQFQGQEAVVADVIEKAKKQFEAEGHRASSIKSIQVYLKPEEYAAYYVINQKHAGRVDLF